MAPKQVVMTASAPKPIAGVYSQAIVAKGTVYYDSLKETSETARILQCIKNLTHVLEAAGTSIDNVIKVNVFITDMEYFSTMNAVYKLYWGDEKPSRTCVAVKELPRGTDVEIECIAVLS
ncbi:hypothetical protein M409DRAFT_63887 [Zasmidium cellare ATCC 36951]|uniref:Uncharacterized protein n=1 Tax=Zasmidium cellare ATCC 36951 TaxID=1080233 RepID=A0A6A6CXA9_ZASCE|nr:uncharacterized protein M409DRAFT_63887 [Zasmidium cellare ATCC 36951]KAF2170840.1 hypothetical protein M409DRAFT_63887 [Zasmidium cellare ATCC 36951]